MAYKKIAGNERERIPEGMDDVYLLDHDVGVGETQFAT
jgi:hypothetical protein